MQNIRNETKRNNQNQEEKTMMYVAVHLTEKLEKEMEKRVAQGRRRSEICREALAQYFRLDKVGE